MTQQNKAALIILDGWGIGSGGEEDAVNKANTPFVDSLWQEAAHAQLLTHGAHVGLPDGQMGNSEVGHMNIGAGRIVYQDLARINKAIAEGDFFKNEILKAACAEAKAKGVTLHLIGLLSDGGVHSSQEHLHALIDMAEAEGVERTAIHAITDGRDTDPHGGRQYLKRLLAHCEGKKTEVASLIGRYYAMDRDKRWERVAKAYDLFTQAQGSRVSDLASALETSYAAGVTDEFLEPVAAIGSNGLPIATVKNGDVVVCFNFRTDRCREFTVALTQRAFPEWDMKPLDLYYVTMTNYDQSFKGVRVAYDKDNLSMTLGEVVAKNGLTQVRIAETEKYPHVTFFFSGGREAPFAGEDRIMAASPKVATYDLQPEMSAFEVRDKIVAKIEADAPDFVCLNFANPDMVGHTGVFDAIVKAVETTDNCTKEVVDKLRAEGYSVVIIADHGNAEKTRNEDGSPHTAHTTNPVPVFVLADEAVVLRDGILADIAPTILKLMKVTQPEEMTGEALF